MVSMLLFCKTLVRIILTLPLGVNVLLYEGHILDIPEYSQTYLFKSKFNRKHIITFRTIITSIIIIIFCNDSK